MEIILALAYLVITVLVYKIYKHFFTEKFTYYFDKSHVVKLSLVFLFPVWFIILSGFLVTKFINNLKKEFKREK